MESARLKHEQTKSEPVSDRSQKTLTPVATSSHWIALSDVHPPAVQLGQAFRPLHAFMPPAIQTKLTVNEPGDQYEQEADRVAAQVMRMPDLATRLQRKCGCEGSTAIGGSCEECGGQSTKLQRATTEQSSPSAPTPPVMRDVLRSPGQALDASTLAFMETRFGRNFGHVRVHTDQRAADSAKGVNALAYTVGRDIVFARDRYSPNTHVGQQLIAHELAHVLQQSGTAGSIQRQEAGSGAQTPQSESGRLSASERQLAEQQRFDTFQSQQMAVLRRINSLLGTSITDWAVTDEEARAVLTILQRLRRENPEMLLSVLMMMRLSGRMRTFGENLTEGDRQTLQDLLRDTDRNAGFIMPGDDIRLDITGGGAIERQLSIEYNVSREGVQLLLVPQPVPIVGMLPLDAVNAIARAYIDALIYSEPIIRLQVTKRGVIYAPNSGATSQSLWFTSNVITSATAAEIQRRRKFSEFMSYIRFAEIRDALTTSASNHYLAWIEQNRTQPEFLTRQPAELWGWALSQASRPAPVSPIQPFLELARTMFSRLAGASADERPRIQGALNRFLGWMDAHREDPNLSRHDPVEIWAQSYQRSSQLERARMEDRYLREVSEPRADTPEVAQARANKFQEFYSLAMQLWGYSARNYPYRIPIDVEGRDILVTGDPARQAVFNDLARDFMNWATQHFHEQTFPTINPRMVLADILSAGRSATSESAYERRLREAVHAPLVHESIDRRELMPGRVLASFGETVATGLLVIALVGAAVGLGVPAAVAGVILLGVAAFAGISSYLTRRREIERQQYDVPIPETMLAAAGDVVGLSQMIEGITGERLSTSQRLGSIERSEQLGSGAGNVALLLGGSRAYRAGQLRGQRLRLSLPGQLPTGPEGGVRVPPGQTPVVPEPSVRLGPTEARVRANLRDVPSTAANPRRLLADEMRMGFDDWMAEIRRNGGDPEAVLNRMRDPDAVARTQAERRTRNLLEEFQSEMARRRSTDNPLNPIMRNTRRVGDITIRYNRLEPAPHEIAQAQEIHNRTGEPIELFGDTASGNAYPGIDGVIGNPPRPLSLKHGGPAAHANYARWSAEEAFAAARDNGYSHVEVHIKMEGRTVAEIQAAWDAAPSQPGQLAGRSVFDAAGRVARYIIQGIDGIWVLEPPLSGPALPGVGLPQQGRGQEQRR